MSSAGTIHHMRPHRELCVLFLLASVGGALAADQEKAQNAEEVVATVLDESISGRKRIQVLQEIGHLSVQECAHVYWRAIAEAEDGIAIQSAACAIQQGILPPEVVEALQQRISNWASEYRFGVLEYIVDAGTPQVLMPIVRGVLRLVPTQRPMDRSQQEAVVLAINKVAGVFVARANDPDDIKLLRDAVESYPEAYIGWLALDKLDAMDDAMYALARDVYSETHYGRLARLAAAIAAQQENQNATGAALDIIRAYLREYSRSMEELFPGEGARDWTRMDRAQRARLFRMDEEAPTMLLLRFVKSDEARALALEYLDSPNELVGDHVQLVAAQKWPNDVKANILKIPVSKRAYALAKLGYFHPVMDLPLTTTGVTADELQAAKQKLAKEISAKPEVYRLLTDL